MSATVLLISDFICPWCYLATKQVEEASKILKESFKDIDFDIQLKSHILRPQHLKTPNEVFDKKEMYKKGFNNNVGKMLSLKSELTHLFSEVGLQYSMEGSVSHTLHAHRLMYYLENNTKLSHPDLLQIGLKIFEQYHTNGKALNQLDALLEVCEVNENIDKDEVKAFLESKDLTDETLNMIEETPKDKRYQFTKGVPHILVSVGDENFIVPGAQDVAYFVRTIKKMLENAGHQALASV